MMKTGIKIGLIGSSLLLSLQSFAEGGQVKFNGELGAGIMMHSIDKAKTSNSEVAAACSAEGAECGPAKAMSSNVLSSGYATNRFGAKYEANPSTSATFDLGVKLGSKEVSLRKLYVQSKMPFGDVLIGRQNSIFGDVAGGADNMLYAADALAGVLYETRNTGARVNVNAMGPVQISVGLFSPVTQLPGPAELGASPMPSTELSINFSQGIVRGSLAHQMEHDSLKDGAKTVSPSIFALSGGVDISSVSATVVYVTGDPLYHSVTKSGSISKGLKDKITGLSFWAQNDFGMAVLGIFYGTESTKLDNSAALKEAASSMGVSASVKANDLKWALEFSQTSRTLKGDAVNSDTYIGAAAVYEFKS